MFWDDSIRRLRREHGAISPRLLRAAGGHVAIVPAHLGRRVRPLAVLVVLAVLAVAALVESGRFSIHPNVAPQAPTSAAVVA